MVEVDVLFLIVDGMRQVVVVERQVVVVDIVVVVNVKAVVVVEDVVVEDVVVGMIGALSEMHPKMNTMRMKRYALILNIWKPGLISRPNLSRSSRIRAFHPYLQAHMKLSQAPDPQPFGRCQ